MILDNYYKQQLLYKDRKTSDGFIYSGWRTVKKGKVKINNIIYTHKKLENMDKEKVYVTITCKYAIG